MSPDHETKRSLQWLTGVALVDGGEPLPMRACASKSTLRAVGPGADGASTDIVPSVHGDHVGIRLIFNDDHGMTPSVTIVNQTGETVSLQAVIPAVLATEKGTYDVAALLAGEARRIEPGHPLVIRITDIGRNLNDPCRIGFPTAGSTDTGRTARRTVS